jgi:hypothetical protein
MEPDTPRHTGWLWCQTDEDAELTQRWCVCYTNGTLVVYVDGPEPSPMAIIHTICSSVEAEVSTWENTSKCIFEVVSGRQRTKLAAESPGGAMAWIEVLLEQAQPVAIDIVYENERRWSTKNGFGVVYLLPTDSSWVDAHGRPIRDKDALELPRYVRATMASHIHKTSYLAVPYRC